ncbi:MAG: hypothetical protein GEU73_07515 [Chloroflexi bacterium]|nr:hypothetical protein [Chloroflexota bacterium]
MSVPVLSRRSRVIALAVVILVAAMAGAAVFTTVVRGTGAAEDAAVPAEVSESTGGSQLGSAPARDPAQPVGLELHPSRGRLAICIQPERGAQINTDEARGRVQAALAEAAKHPRWEQLGYGRADPVADVGCPFEPAGLDPDASPAERVHGLPGIRNVEHPSPYRLAVWVLPPDEFERLLPNDSAKRIGRLPPQEHLCEAPKQCGTVTGGLVLSTEEFGDPAALAYWIKRGLVIEGVEPRPTATPDPRIPPDFRLTPDEIYECQKMDIKGSKDCAIWAIEQRGGA